LFACTAAIRFSGGRLAVTNFGPGTYQAELAALDAKVSTLYRVLQQLKLLRDTAASCCQSQHRLACEELFKP
jgi:hypothetical protein